jgi:hypothetical protein
MGYSVALSPSAHSAPSPRPTSTALHMTDSAPLTAPTNHVFVDFENVHEVDPAVIGSKSTSVIRTF